jgi:hypothetical protein
LAHPCTYIHRYILTTYTCNPVSTCNYTSTANLHNSQITTAPAKPFPALFVFTSRSLATTSNTRDTSVSRAQDLSSQIPVQNCLSSNLVPCLSQHGPHRKHNSSIVQLLCPCLLLWERVYGAVARKRSWYMRPYRGYYMTTALHLQYYTPTSIYVFLVISFQVTFPSKPF